MSPTWLSEVIVSGDLFKTEKPFVPVPLTSADRLVSSIAFGFTVSVLVESCRVVSQCLPRRLALVGLQLVSWEPIFGFIDLGVLPSFLVHAYRQTHRLSIYTWLI